MIKQNIFSVAVLILCVFTSCAHTKDGFTKLPSGLEYRIVNDVKGDKKATEGCEVLMHVIMKMGDSTQFNSYKMNNNEPVPGMIGKPQFKGDVMEGLPNLSEGDSAIFRLPVDTLLALNKMAMPSFLKKGDWATWYIKMVKIKTKEDIETEKKESIQKEKSIIDEYAKSKGLTTTTTPSGLQYVITKPGTGANAVAGQKVSMNYTGMLTSNEKFDSNVDPNFKHVQPFEFNLGTGQVIKGWDEGLTYFNKGSKGFLLIPSSLAYGQNPPPGSPIKPNSVLIFEVEMLDIK